MMDLTAEFKKYLAEPELHDDGELHGDATAVSGEVLDGPIKRAAALGPTTAPTAKAGELSPQQLQAAVIDATHDIGRNDLAELVGVSQRSIQKWREKPAYQHEVERLRASNIAAVTEPMKRLRKNMIAGMEDAIQELRDSLQANTKKGDPMYSVRHKAAELLLQYGVEIQKEESKAANFKGAGGLTQAVQINVTATPPEPPR